MIDGRSCLGVIVGRGGSKGLPGKNVAPLGGRPLVAWSVAAAREARLLDHVVVSSDDDAILDAAVKAGCTAPVRRPPQLATDDASVADAVLHALDSTGRAWDYVVLLQATSPLRTGCDIDGCLQLCHSTGANTAVAVCPSAKPPQWMFDRAEDGRLVPLFGWEFLKMRRQQIPEVFTVNGAVYVVRGDWFRENRAFYDDSSVGYVMPPERSVDIDSAADLEVARALIGIS